MTRPGPSATRAFEPRASLASSGASRPGMRVLLPPGCGDPQRAGRGDHAVRRTGWRRSPSWAASASTTIRSPPPPMPASLRFATWHMSPRLFDAAGARRRGLRPARYFESVAMFAAGRTRGRPDAVLVHTAPPDCRGLSVARRVGELSAARGAAGAARHRAGEPRMPRTLGKAFLHRSQIDCWVEVDEPLRRVSADADRGRRARDRAARGRPDPRRRDDPGRASARSRRPSWRRSGTGGTSACTRSWSSTCCRSSRRA